MKPTIGISACLQGDKVRYDGGHKKLAFLVDELSRHIEFYPVCPEVAIGMGIPRPPIRLVRANNDEIRVRDVATGETDVTDALKQVAVLNDAPELSGYLFCAKSPSCGVKRVPVYTEEGNFAGKEGVGAYAEAFMARNPLLPVEENGRLFDPELRENFVTRIFALHRWQTMTHSGVSRGSLQAFHRDHKFLLLSHSQSHYRRLGPLLATDDDAQTMAASYLPIFMDALSKPASRGDHTNTLMHIQGFFDELDEPERKELTQVIHKYREGLLPLMAPLSLLKLFLKKYSNPYLEAQTYLDPYPEDLQLRYGL